jgi:hypothetical protein
MNAATTRKLQYAATLLGAMAFVALAPATANAQPVNGAGDGGCHYTDKDGYDIPIDDGQSVLVDGKTVSCSGGTITVSKATKGGLGNVRPGQIGSVFSPVNEAPKQPVATQTLPVFVAQR